MAFVYKKAVLVRKKDRLSEFTNKRLTPGGKLLLPPGSTKRCNTLLLAMGVKRSTNKIARTPFVVGLGVISRRFVILYRSFSAAASHRPTLLQESKNCLMEGTPSIKLFVDLDMVSISLRKRKSEEIYDAAKSNRNNQKGLPFFDKPLS